MTPSQGDHTGIDVVSFKAFPVPVSAKTTWIFTELRLQEGPSGWGEATFAGAEHAVLAAVAQLHQRVASKPWAMRQAVPGTSPVAHVAQAEDVVRHAWEQASLDALARRSGAPLTALLGGAARRAVPVYANINRGISDRSPAGFAARARAVLAEEAYQAVKIAPFDGLDWSQCDPFDTQRLLAEGIARIGAVREAIGPGPRLLVDCHSRLSPVMARTVLRETEPARLYWLEEALNESLFDARTARGLRTFANDRGILIAGGEHVRTMLGARIFLAREACDAVLPDLRLTGVRTGMAILDLVAAAGVGVSLHNPVGPVLDGISIQVAAALPNLLILERQVRESPLFDEIRGPSSALTDGYYPLGASAGFGTAPDPLVLDKLRPASVSN